jgi:hypothetical protein
MPDVVELIIGDIRFYLAIILLLIISGAFFVALKEVPMEDSAKESIEKLERNTINSFKIILWGFGILGTIVFITLIIALIKEINL